MLTFDEIVNRTKRMETKPYELIGSLIPKGKITLLHGRSGSGKTYSLLSFLNKHDIEPIYLDFDDNDMYKDTFKMIHLDGKLFVGSMRDKVFAKSVKREFRDRVIIIDTYTNCNLALSAVGSEARTEDIAKMFEGINCTVIVIAHTDYYSGKKAEPDTDKVFANHVACRLHLHKEDSLDKRNKSVKTIIYLEIEKLRGVSKNIVPNWMREEELNVDY